MVKRREETLTAACDSRERAERETWSREYSREIEVAVVSGEEWRR